MRQTLLLKVNAIKDRFNLKVLLITGIIIYNAIIVTLSLWLL